MATGISFLGPRRVALAVVLAASVLPLASGGAGAQETPDPLVTDSLAAVSGLVAKANCSVKDAVDGDVTNEVELPYVFCDDGLPAAGGGDLAVPVPAKYKDNSDGEDWRGLPKPASVEEVTAADEEEDLQPESDNRISLDVDITLPVTGTTKKLLEADVPTVRVPKGGFPVVVFMHGCCGGNKTSWEAANVDAANEQWHHSNAWFASRGYVVINYTARGFRNSENRGSTGTTQLDSRRFEINDYQYLVGLLVDHDEMRRDQGEAPLFKVNPRKVAAVGGSYGGGFAWLALTDPTWKSPAGDIPIRLRAVVTKYGWTDLVESLVPSGHYFDRDPQGPGSSIAPTDIAKALSRDPIGVEKQSIVSGLYATGNFAAGNHTTFPEWLHQAFTRLQEGEPYDGDATLEPILESFLRDRSAYFQDGFWERVRRGLRVPLYAAATWTDPLFPTMETIRFYNKLRSVDPNYPITTYLGDYQHFAQNKPKEWDDLCGSDHHVCTVDDYRRDDGSLNLMSSPARVRAGINTRMNRFLDFYLRDKGTRPRANVTATTTVCPATATDKYKADEPGIEHKAVSWRQLAPDTVTYGWGAGGTTTSGALDLHAQESDPVARDQTDDKCFTTSQANPGAGVVVYEDDVGKTFTMMGIPTLTLEHETTGADYWLAARLFEKDAEGTMTMVTRGVCRVNTAVSPDETCEKFELFGNGWTFDKGNKIVIEVTQGDTPFLRRDNFPSMTTYGSANVNIPVAPASRKADFRG